jgi:nucleoside-diphosphate-sugar epimerase
MSGRFNDIFVTGGGGYVGSALVPRLLESGHHVRVYDLFIYGDTLEDHPRLEKIKGDIRDKEKLLKSARWSDALIHLACISNDPSFDLNPELGKSINFDAFPNVIDAATSNGVRRLVVASSTSQYGIVDPSVQVTEEFRGNPTTDYARFKLKCEDFLRETDVGDMEYTLVRPATLCGYSPRLRLDLTVNQMTLNALVKKKIVLKGADRMRTHLHIDDMVRAYENIIEAPGEKVDRQAFNVSAVNKTLAEVSQIVKDTLEDPDIEIEHVSAGDDDRSYHVNADKIKRELGFVCLYSIADAVKGLKKAFLEGRIVDPLNNPIYFNIKNMKLLNLK